MDNVTLSQYVGQQIIAVIPILFGDTTPRTYKLVGVETAGMWVASQAFTDILLKSAKQQAAPKTVAVFVPFHQISFVFGAIEGVALYEKALGIEE